MKCKQRAKSQDTIKYSDIHCRNTHIISMKNSNFGNSGKSKVGKYVKYTEVAYIMIRQC